MMKLSPGFYWAKPLLYNSKDYLGLGPWEMIEIRYKSKSTEILEVYTMGWDIPEPISSYDQYIKIEMIDPDGRVFKGLDE